MIRATLLALLGSLACAFDPAPATVHPTGGNDLVVTVKDETIDGLVYLIGGGRGSPSIEGKQAHGKYEVTYEEPKIEVDWLTAVRQEGDNNASAPKTYESAADKTRFAWVRQEALLRAGRLYLAQNKGDDAVRVMSLFEKDFPRGLRLPTALELLGKAQVQRKDLAAAQAVYARLATLSAWGQAAVTLGQVGQAEVFSQQEKYADAAKLLAEVLKTQSPDDEAFGKAGLALADAQMKLQQVDAAIVTWRKVTLAEVSASYQARAHARVAKQLLIKGGKANVESAFDHAAIGTVLPGADAGASDEAGKALRDALNRIQDVANKDFTDKEKLEYRQYRF